MTWTSRCSWAFRSPPCCTRVFCRDVDLEVERRLVRQADEGLDDDVEHIAPHALEEPLVGAPVVS